MNINLKRGLIALGFISTAVIGGAVADVAVTAGSGTTIFAFTCFTTKVCPAAVTINSAGTEIGTAGAPIRVDPTGTTTQPVSLTSTTVTGSVATSTAVNVTMNNCSGTITAGGTAQNVFTAGATKHGFIIQSLPDVNEPMWISFTTTAASEGAASYILNPGTNSENLAGGSFTSPVGMGTSGAVSIVSATTGKKYSCTWW